ncbi:MAG: hypothetical protein KDL87_10660, partial [Verrucomicrobiae bacterium]|nr:hypothetical protein [Verrucomicrobiae bacterium]
TSTAWKGDRKFEEFENNRALVIEAKKNRSVMVSQETNTRELADLTVKFRYRSADYKGRGLQFRGTRTDDSSTFRTLDVKADGQWHDYSTTFTAVRGSKEVTFSFELLEGEGTVYIDDVVIEGKS